ncbi:MAG: DUF4417 domain-containing protein [Micrococcales bacterium]
MVYSHHQKVRFIDMLILSSPPDGLPVDVEVEPKFGFPILPYVDKTFLTDQLVPFNSLGRAEVRSETLAHFFKEDYKFASHLLDCDYYASKYLDMKGVISFDLTLGRGMHWIERLVKTKVARQCAASLVSKGVNVVPLVSWVELSDFEFAMLGVADGSSVAVSNYGILSNPDLLEIFYEGLIFLAETYRPSGVLVYGKLENRMLGKLSTLTHVVVSSPSSWRTTGNLITEHSQLTLLALDK